MRTLRNLLELLAVLGLIGWAVAIVAAEPLQYPTRTGEVVTPPSGEHAVSHAAGTPVITRPLPSLDWLIFSSNRSGGYTVYLSDGSRYDAPNRARLD